MNPSRTRRVPRWSPIVWLACLSAVACSDDPQLRKTAIVGVTQGPDSRTLMVNLAACNAERHQVDVNEDDRQVVLNAGTANSGEGFCSDGVQVTLRKDLGGRVVIDGTSDKEVSLSPKE